jgi:hypothetical protein
MRRLKKELLEKLSSISSEGSALSLIPLALLIR